MHFESSNEAKIRREVLIRPNLEPVSLYNGGSGIKQRYDSCYQDAVTILQSSWAEANANQRFETGDSTIFSQWYGTDAINNRRSFSMNHIRRIRLMITGRQRQNRKSTICIPIENGDNKTADQMTKVLGWVHRNGNMYETISEAFDKGAIINGMNLLQIWVDWREDPISGNVKLDNRDYSSFVIDPYFKKPDMSDCNFVILRTWMTKAEAISLYPDYEDMISTVNYDGTKGDGKFQYMSENYNYGMRNLIAVDEFYYRDYRKQKLLVDTVTGESQENKIKDSEMLEYFLAKNPELTMIEQTIPTVKLAVFIQNQTVYDGPEPHGLDRYPLIPVFGYYNPQLPYYPQRLQSVVSNLRDPQYLYNRRLIIELDMLESMSTSGYIFKENALIDPTDVYKTGQGRGIAIKEEAQMTDVQQIQPVVVPPTTQQVRQDLRKEIVDVSGANEELMGSASDDKAGILSMLRQGAGLTTLQLLFDQLDMAQKEVGKIILDLIQINFTPGKIKKILEGEEPSPQFYSKAFGKYGCTVEEGLNTTTQRQMQLAQMVQLSEWVPFTPEDYLDVATFQGKDKILENIAKKQEQQSKMEQMRNDIEMKELESRIRLADARAHADMGLFAERTSRVEENRALAIKQLHEANHQDDLALLDKVRALKELHSMDISHIQELVNTAAILKDMERADVEPLKEENRAAQGGPEPVRGNNLAAP